MLLRRRRPHRLRHQRDRRRERVEEPGRDGDAERGESRADDEQRDDALLQDVRDDEQEEEEGEGDEKLVRARAGSGRRKGK